MSVTPETHQPAMAPYFAVAASASESYSVDAVFRSALLVKVWPVHGGGGLDGGGLSGGGEGEGGGGEGEGGGGEGEGGGGLGEGGGGEGEGGGGLGEGGVEGGVNMQMHWKDEEHGPELPPPTKNREGE